MSAGTLSAAPGKPDLAKGRRTHLADGIWGAGTVVLVLLLWEVLSRTGVLPAIAFQIGRASCRERVF